jgi:hypothetical protein
MRNQSSLSMLSVCHFLLFQTWQLSIRENVKISISHFADTRGHGYTTQSKSVVTLLESQIIIKSSTYKLLMGGRGRGRGNAVSFNIEQLGFGRGEAGPVSVTQPPPLFPSLGIKLFALFVKQCKVLNVFPISLLENRPLPLIKDVENEYILVTQKDLSTRMRNSPFYLKKSEK